MSFKNKLKSFFEKSDFEDLGWLDAIAYFVCMWFFIYPTPYTLLFCIMLCIPIIGIVLKTMDGNRSLDDHVSFVRDKENKERRVIAMYLTAVAWCLGLRVFLDFECENFYSILTHASVAFILLAIALFISHKKITGTIKHQLGLYSLLTLNILLYSYAAVYGLNCLFDNSTPIQFRTHIIQKYISHHRKRSDTYHVTVAPWGHHHDTENLSIPYDQYNNLNEGDEILMDLQEGLFDIPWYHVDASDKISSDW